MIGVVSGTGGEQWPGIEGARQETRRTRFGTVEVVCGELGGVEVAHVARHGRGHERLSNHVEHRANVAALKDLGATAILSTTACGAVDGDIALGAVVVFDDLYFPSNRLPDGSVCTFFDTPGEPGRGHYIFDGPFDERLRRTVLVAGDELGLPVVDGGTYGHVDGPRFNTRSEIAALKSVGVTAVSQTAGPEAVLAGEAEIAFALVGFVTDYANGVGTEPQSAEDLMARVQQSTEVLPALIERALSGGLDGAPDPSRVVVRFE